MTSKAGEDRDETREAHECAIAELSEKIARMDESHPASMSPRADVLFLHAQLIRHRISLALLDAEPAGPSSVR